jgi:hypothetical protein
MSALATGSSAPIESGTLADFFPDAALAQAVLPAVSVESIDAGTVTAAELADIPALSAANRGIRDIAGIEYLSGAQSIALEGNAIQSIPAGAFSGFTGLRELYLNKNELAGLPSGLFDDLNGLQRLDLSNNRLAALPPGLFDSLGAPEYLNLEFNCLYDISMVPVGALVDLQQVTRAFYVQDASAPIDAFLPPAGTVLICGQDGSVNATDESNPAYMGEGGINAPFALVDGHLEANLCEDGAYLMSADGTLYLQSYVVQLIEFPAPVPQAATLRAGETLAAQISLPQWLSGYTPVLSLAALSGTDCFTVDADTGTITGVQPGEGTIRVSLRAPEDPALLREAMLSVTVTEAAGSATSGGGEEGQQTGDEGEGGNGEGQQPGGGEESGQTGSQGEGGSGEGQQTGSQGEGGSGAGQQPGGSDEGGSDEGQQTGSQGESGNGEGQQSGGEEESGQTGGAEQGQPLAFGTLEGSTDMQAHIEKELAGFLRLLLGGKQVEIDNYTVASGSTILTLRGEYVQSLPAGDYTFMAEYADGQTVPITLHVAANASGNAAAAARSAAKGQSGEEPPAPIKAPMAIALTLPKTGAATSLVPMALVVLGLLGCMGVTKRK